MKYYNRAPRDSRAALSGKDGAIYTEDGELLATCESWQSTVNINNAAHNFLGSAQTYRALLNYEVSITLNMIVVSSDETIRQVYEMMSTGVPIYFTFQGVVGGYDGSEERVIYRDCVPDGQIDLHNLQAGDLWKRSMTFYANTPPELQTLLTEP